MGVLITIALVPVVLAAWVGLMFCLLVYVVEPLARFWSSPRLWVWRQRANASAFKRLLDDVAWGE